MGIINRKLFLAKCGAVISVSPSMLATEHADNSCGFPVMDDRKFALGDSPPGGFPRSLRIVSMEKHNSGSVLRIANGRINDHRLYFFN